VREYTLFESIRLSVLASIHEDVLLSRVAVDVCEE